jgi:hypothetical protein
LEDREHLPERPLPDQFNEFEYGRDALLKQIDDLIDDLSQRPLPRPIGCLAGSPWPQRASFVLRSCLTDAIFAPPGPISVRML